MLKMTIACMSLLAILCTSASAGTSDWAEIEKVLQRPGIHHGDELALFYPRTDLTVKINGVPLDPSMGLTSWVLFRKTGGSGGVIGEIVVVKKELELVLKS